MSASNGYPFQSKRMIAEKVRTSRAYALEVFRILLARSALRTAGAQGSFGFMASHASAIRDLAAKLEERPLDDAEHARLVEILVRYSRQLAAHFRVFECQARPELIQVAATFSAIPAGATETPEAKGTKEGGKPVVIAAESSVVVVDAPPPRRRGRPPGSRNRPKEEPSPKRRKRS